MAEPSVVFEIIQYVGERFGGSGLLIAYFIIKDYLAYKKKEEKKENGEWVDLKRVEGKIYDTLDGLQGCGFSSDKFAEVVKDQSRILTEILYQQKDNGGALNRIEGKLDRNNV